MSTQPITAGDIRRPLGLGARVRDRRRSRATQPPSQTSSPHHSLRAGLPPKKLLIADDQEGVRQLVRMILQSDDFEVLEARDGEEALALAHRHRPGLILLDVMMPKLSGFQVCRRLKEDPDTAAIPVLMLTVKAQGDDFAEGEDAGADGYFVKPFSPLALLKRVEEIFSEGAA